MASALMATPVAPTARLPPSQISPLRTKLTIIKRTLLIKGQQKISKPPISLIKFNITPVLKNGFLIALNTMVAMPALAEIEKAKLFEFNLTLPIIMAEFLLLMVALDSIWFKPLGKFMDERDAMIREKLMSVRDNSDEIKRLQEEADAILKAARAEVTAALNQMKKEMSAELEQKMKESRERVEKELEVALEKLEAQKEETLRSLDRQIEGLSQEIVQKVLPFKIQ